MKIANALAVVVVLSLSACGGAHGDSLFGSPDGGPAPDAGVGGGGSGTGGARLSMVGDICVAPNGGVGRVDKGGGCCTECLDVSGACRACVEPDAGGPTGGAGGSGGSGGAGGGLSDDAGTGGRSVAMPVVATSCGVCPTGYSEFGLSSTPNDCGATGCGGPFTEHAICLRDGATFTESCSAAPMCPAGQSVIGSVPTCDCPGGWIWFCGGAGE